MQLELTGYQPTSRIAYYSLEDLGSKQLRVYECLSKFGNMTNTECSIKLGWTINRVTPRMNELVNKCNLVEEKTKRPCSITKRLSIVWGIK